MTSKRQPWGGKRTLVRSEMFFFFFGGGGKLQFAVDFAHSNFIHLYGKHKTIYYFKGL